MVEMGKKTYERKKRIRFQKAKVRKTRGFRISQEFVRIAAGEVRRRQEQWLAGLLERRSLGENFGYGGDGVRWETRKVG